MATSRSYGKAKNSTPHRIKTPNLIEIKFGTVDYVGEMTPSTKFHANPSMGVSRQMGEIYAKCFINIYSSIRKNVESRDILPVKHTYPANYDSSALASCTVLCTLRKRNGNLSITVSVI